MLLWKKCLDFVSWTACREVDIRSLPSVDVYVPVLITALCDALGKEKLGFYLHHLAHFTGQIENLGPLYLCSCAMCEAKHRALRCFARMTNNRVEHHDRTVTRRAVLYESSIRDEVLRRDALRHRDKKLDLVSCPFQCHRRRLLTFAG